MIHHIVIHKLSSGLMLLNAEIKPVLDQKAILTYAPFFSALSQFSRGIARKMEQDPIFIESLTTNGLSARFVEIEPIRDLDDETQRDNLDCGLIIIYKKYIKKKGIKQPADLEVDLYRLIKGLINLIKAHREYIKRWEKNQDCEVMTPLEQPIFNCVVTFLKSLQLAEI